MAGAMDITAEMATATASAANSSVTTAMATDMAGEMATDAVKPMSDRLTVILPLLLSPEEEVLGHFKRNGISLTEGSGIGDGYVCDYGDGRGSGVGSSYSNNFRNSEPFDGNGHGAGYGINTGEGFSQTNA